MIIEKLHAICISKSLFVTLSSNVHHFNIVRSTSEAIPKYISKSAQDTSVYETLSESERQSRERESVKRASVCADSEITKSETRTRERISSNYLISNARLSET